MLSKYYFHYTLNPTNLLAPSTQALVFQQRAVLMSERVHGIDSANTITEYSHLALYCFANNQVSTSLKLMYRARYLAMICHGENHPQIALFDVSPLIVKLLVMWAELDVVWYVQFIGES